VYGKTGMGKTRWSRAFLRSQSRVIVMDPMLEHDGIVFDDLGDMIDHLMRYPTFRVRTEFLDDFPMLCSIVFATGRCWLVVEETQRILPASRKELPAPFLDLIYRGRHKRVSLLMISQRPSTVHIAARSQWTRIITFNQTEPADIGWIQSASGFDVDPATLPPSWYYEITPTTFEKKLLDDARKGHETISTGREMRHSEERGDDE
jgi:hypothetical protein